jgi:hypothetical protein
MELNPDFQEFLRSFVDHDVRFLIVGGYALAAHGHPRYTKDLDVWVWTDPDNASRVVEALDDFGFGGLGLSAADFEDPDIEWIKSPRGVRHNQIRTPAKIG